MARRCKHRRRSSGALRETSLGSSPVFTINLKDGKATMTIGTESQTLDYKVDGNMLNLLTMPS
jgi:hypothetical protein